MPTDGLDNASRLQPRWGLSLLSPLQLCDVSVEGSAHIIKVREYEGVLCFKAAGDDVSHVFPP